MFTEERIGEILKQLDTLRYPQAWAIPGWKMRRSGGEARPTPMGNEPDWTASAEAPVWGGHCEYFAFSAAVAIPPEMAGKCVEFTLFTGREGQWDATNPQFTVYVDGTLRQGFDVNHTSLLLTEEAKAGEVYSIFLSAYTGVQNFHLEFRPFLRSVDRAVEKLYYDLLIPYQIACLLDKADAVYIALLGKLNRAVNLLDLRKAYSPEFSASLVCAEAYLMESLYSEKSAPETTVCCVGHTHIDIAWLWTLSVTRDKAVRSFATVLELMKRYPEYIFMSSQPQLYQYVKETAPEIYAGIKKRVAEGRWEPEGGMYVEPDCNLASGESLVRQLLYGKRFFQREFGADNRILWLPDVFGYSAALPQIIKKCGMEYFMTTKISWNETNQLPFDTFYWKGIDGTRVLTHFVPTRDYISKERNISTSKEHKTAFSTNYNGYITPSQVKGAWQRCQQKELSDKVLLSYGYGDGGGGPTDEMLETGRRLACALPGCPATKQSTARAFFDALKEDLAGKKTPVWSGELYLEYHRGTYTSMARNKKLNRKSEFALQNAELYESLSSRLLGTSYPQETLYTCWEILMRNQFHDILPGSSIKEVYEDSLKEYTQLLGTTDTLIASRLGALAESVARPAGSVIAFNPNGFEASGLVTVSGKLASGLHTQTLADGKSLLRALAVPAMGYAVLTPDSAPAAAGVTVSGDIIDTPYARIQLNAFGQFASYYDKRAGRELLQEGKCGNVLMTYEDKPHIYDNWNLYDYYTEKSWEVRELISRELTECGPLRWAIRLQWHYQDSEITETLYFYPDSPRVDIAFDTDWKEDQIFLKVLFPLEVNTSEASFEIQYGNVKRGTTENTSWDRARFEVCCHKWMDVSEGNFGVSFLNDCKYGVSVLDNTVGLSLLKSGRYPNPDADREKHAAVYAVFPHEGTWQDAGTAKEAYLLNNPLKALVKSGPQGTLSPRYSFVSCDSDSVMVETVKRAEDEEATIIRLYEYKNSRVVTALRLARPAAEIWLCSMLEENEVLLATSSDTCMLEISPYEILTVKAVWGDTRD